MDIIIGLIVAALTVYGILFAGVLIMAILTAWADFGS
jgi:hypothetical protein